MLRQLDLFGAPTIRFDQGFAGIVRRDLAEGAWVEYQPGWVTGHDTLFDELEPTLAWRTEERRMYDKTVTTPRLLASVQHDLVEAMRATLSARYGEEFWRHAIPKVSHAGPRMEVMFRPRWDY